MKTSDFDFELPPELIASTPLERRQDSRMLVVERACGRITHRAFQDFEGLAADYLCVMNNARVAKARHFSDDGKIEVLRLGISPEGFWQCMVRPGKKMRVGATVTLGGVVGTVMGICDDGSRLISFAGEVPKECGRLALPHYMNREQEAADEERYQTVYARQDKADAIAAPTAGLHFTDELIQRLNHTVLTLDVGVGTFQPVKAEVITDHVMHSESYEITPEAAVKINAAEKVLAIGTTVTRVLEHQQAVHGRHIAEKSATNIFIYPGKQFRRVNALLTNFHLPKSTLLMLVSAFAGSKLIQEAYFEAVSKKYRFYSYGDCMLIL